MNEMKKHYITWEQIGGALLCLGVALILASAIHGMWYFGMAAGIRGCWVMNQHAEVTQTGRVFCMEDSTPIINLEDCVAKGIGYACKGKDGDGGLNGGRVIINGVDVTP